METNKWWWPDIDFNWQTCRWLVWELAKKWNESWLTPAEERALNTASLWTINDLTVSQVLKILQNDWNAYIDKKNTI